MAGSAQEFLPGVGSIAHHADRARPGRAAARSPAMRRASDSRDSRVRALDHEPGQHRQAHRPGQRWQRDDDPGDDLGCSRTRSCPSWLRTRRGTTPRRRRPSCRGGGTGASLIATVTGSSVRDQQRHCQAGQGKAEITGLPPGAGEEIMRPWARSVSWSRPAPVSIPHTVRRPVCAQNPQASAQNVRN